MLIKQEDLKKGDEILIASQGKMRILKVIRPPKSAKRPTKWKTHSAAWCSSKIEKVIEKIPYGNTYYTRKYIVHHCAPPSEHNTERYENLNREMWLLNREKQ